jgi:ferredoxin
MGNKTGFTIEKTDFEKLLNKFLDNYRVFGPTKRGLDASFEEISTNDQLFLDYVSTVLPPKKFFHPPRLELFSFDLKKKDNKIKEIKSEEKIMILGIHPCDVHALIRLDQFFTGDFEDPYYQNRRKNTILVAINCVEPSDYAFCNSMGTGPFLDRGYDLLLTDIGTKYLIEIGSEKGKKTLQGLHLDTASDADFTEKNHRYKLMEKRFKRFINPSWLSKIVQENIDHNIWTILGERGGIAKSLPCLSCGSCSFVCPTCYCYDVYDTLDLSLQKGKRIRELDSCQLLEYGEVAQGGNFRRNRNDRVRHWMMCKLGAAAGGTHSSCVGCGRCIRNCPVGIDITEVAKILRGE